MRTAYLRILLLLNLCILPLSAYAKPVSGLKENVGMDFGTIIVAPLGDTITLTTTGTVSSVNGSILTGTPAAGEFQAKGNKNAAVNISFSSGDVLTGAGTDMPLGSFNHNAGATPTFNNKGKISFKVGASLTVNALQVGGLYSGLFTVTLNYP